MSKRVKSLFLLVTGLFLLIGLTSCQHHESNSSHEMRFYSFGSFIDLTVIGVSEATAEDIRSAVQVAVDNMHNKWHAWLPSQLSEIHDACVSNKPVSIDDDMKTLITYAKAAEKKSESLFNPAAGKLIKLWGFFRDAPEVSFKPPSNATIQETLKTLGSMENLTVRNNRLTCNNKNVVLDFGGFGKGYAAEKILSILKQHGVKSGLVNLGGDLITFGKNQGMPWTIALEDPFSDQPIVIIESSNQAIFTSGTYSRKYAHNNKEYHHIINPVTGRPSHGFTSVTVIATNPTLADAAATAILLAGPKKWRRIAENFNINDVLLIRDDKTILVTPNMLRHFNAQDRANNIISIAAIEQKSGNDQWKTELS